MASVIYEAGSARPSDSDITDLLSMTIGSAKPNDLRVILFELMRKVGTADSVESQLTVADYLP